MVSGGAAFSLLNWSTDAPGCASSTVSGPASQPYSVCFVPLTNAGDAVMVQTAATQTWSAGPHSVDINVILWQNDGTSSSAVWSITFILGCVGTVAGAGSFTYVSGAVDLSSPPPQYQYETFFGQGLTPTNCPSDSFLQAWIIRNADSGGSTGVIPRVVSVQIIIRGS
jgi:hypothetical protein